MRVLLSSLSVAALGIAFAGCSGGGRSALPPAPVSQQPVSIVRASVPTTAASGVRVIVALPLRNEAALDQLIADQGNQKSPKYRQYLTPEAFREQFGPTSADLATAANALTAQGFTTAITSLGIIADAPQAVVEKAFGTQIVRTASSVRGSKRTVLKTSGAIRLPSALTALKANVVSLGGVEETNKILKAPLHGTSASGTVKGVFGPYGPYVPSELRQAYQFPSYTAFNGAGRTIAVIGPADFQTSDVDGLWQFEGLTTFPTVTRRPVNGGPPPFDPTDGNAFEIALDIEESGGAAPGAKIIDYQLPTAQDSDFLLGYTAIVEDNLADVVSSSYGACELVYLQQFTGVDGTPIVQHFHNLFRQGNAQGISFLTASGDFGAQDCAPLSGGTSLPFAVDYPSSDPNVTGVGGTSLQTTTKNPLTSNYVSESEFGDPLDPSVYGPGAVFASGGGVSRLFPRPAFQLLVNTGSTSRTVPDVAMQMGGCPAIAIQPCQGPRSASVVVFGGQLVGAVGTSSSSPELAGLLAIASQRAFGLRLGNANSLIYLEAAVGNVDGAPFAHNNIPGNNGYPSHAGYNYVVGNGTPIGTSAILDPKVAVAGDTLSASNP